MAPLFSILVPTRQRPDTLVATLATLVEQPGDDYEIVVADNFGDAEVTQVIEAAQKLNPRVRHIRSESVLPMAVNWERGLAACTGKYVTVLGDDDGFLPGTLKQVRNLIALSGAQIINWNVHTYWWPDTIAFWHANRLYANTSANGVEWRESAAVLSAFFGDRLSFGDLPMIYTAFVDREIIEIVIDKYGHYFTPPEIAPDVSSGVINLIFSERYLQSRRPLAIRGNSKRSVGTSGWARAFGKQQYEAHIRDEGNNLEKMYHSKIIPSPNVAFAIASMKLFLKDTFFSGNDDFQVDLRALVISTITNLNFEPESYDDNLVDALRLADKIGMKVDPLSIPPKQPPRIRNRWQGPYGNPQSGMGIAVNCDQARVYDVAGAARLAEAISPPLDLNIVALPATNVAPIVSPPSASVVTKPAAEMAKSISYTGT
jgi:glycosyltransferase involved in cell wall biosynthesis